MDTSPLARALADVVGEPHVLTDPADQEPFLLDWTGTHRGRAAAVVRPASTAEVAGVVSACRGAGAAVVPQGGNTGLCAGATPDGSGRQVVVSLGRLRRVRALDPVGDTVVAEAGVVLADLQRAAEAAERLFPLSLGSEGSCTVGGVVSTNAGGTGVLRYGMTRELVLGLEVVLPDGRVWDGLRALRKDNTGYDLAGLHVGAEGTLGVVTAAAFRLFPATPRRATALVAVSSPADALALLGVARRVAGAHLDALELIGRTALELVVAHHPGAREPFGDHHPWYVLVELAAPEAETGLDDALLALLSAAADAGLVRDAVVAANPTQRSGLWALREGVSEAQRVEGATLKHDVTLPLDRLADWVEQVGPVVEDLLPGVRLVTYGHVGDGNLHYNLSAPPGADDALRAAAPGLTDAVLAAAAAAGGSISAEHGLGRTKAAAGVRHRSAVETSLLRSIKDALDPDGLMNPGVALPPEG